jgi:hypothetical protein
MMHSLLCPAMAALSLAAGCGDNSKICGPGTGDLDGDGSCEPGAPAMCSNGTILDPRTNSCAIDPASCQNGTVLINNRCVDPTEGLVIDLSEGPEPNNAGTGGVEPSGAFAGQIDLPAQGQTYVVKGTINPFRDDDGNGELDPDMDTYTMTVPGPTLLEISVDGVNGLMGAFMLVPLGDNPATGWRRFGLNITGDTSKRQIYLPAAGKYGISVADTRSLFVDSDAPPAAGSGAAAGSPQAIYFMSITALPTPAPTTLTVTGGAATSTGTLGVGDVRFFTVPMGSGLNDVELDIPTTPRAAVAVTRNDIYRADAAERYDFFEGRLPARLTVGGFLPGDRPLIAVDTVYHYGPGGAPYTLAVRPGSAVALSRTGGMASHPEVPGQKAVFYYDVAADDEVTGFALTWNQPVGGMIVDDRVVPLASFTYDPGSGQFTNHTFTSYTGLIRHRSAGRHYFLVFDPAGTGPTVITATSAIAAQTVGTIQEGTPLADQPASTAFHANALLYDAGTTDRWQVFNATGTGTGAIANAVFDRAAAYGRLGALASTGTGPLVPDATPIFTQTFPEAGGAQGRVLLDDPATRFLVTTSTATVTGAPAFTLDFRARTYHDFMALAAGQSVTLANEPLDATSPVRFYLLRATPGNKLTITVHPGAPTLDTQIQLLARDEAILRTIDAGLAGADETAQVLQTSAGWTAFAVSAKGPVAGGATFDLTVGAATF